MDGRAPSDIGFTEPNLSFKLRGASPDFLVTVVLDQEFYPDPARYDFEPASFDFRVTRDQLEEFARGLELEYGTFPARAL